MIRSPLAAAAPWILALSVLAVPAAAQAPARAEVIVATTTSLNDTGLLDSLAARFTAATGYRMRVVAVGSGQALRMGERGDADVILTHAPDAEEAFMSAGHGVRRRPVAGNWFTIVGPPGDPAGIRGASDAGEALRRIAAAGVRFVSRGDRSGTHQRELALWGGEVARQAWPGYIETGQGMAATLLVADERRAYTLTDHGTFGTLRRRLALVPLREREPALLNRYSVIELDAARHPRMNAPGGTAFADFMVSAEVQSLLRTFGASRFGEPLFQPAR